MGPVKRVPPIWCPAKGLLLWGTPVKNAPPEPGCEEISDSGESSYKMKGLYSLKPSRKRKTGENQGTLPHSKRLKRPEHYIYYMCLMGSWTKNTRWWSRCNKILSIGKSGWWGNRSVLYCSGNFSVSLKLFQDKLFLGKRKKEALFPSVICYH